MLTKCLMDEIVKINRERLKTQCSLTFGNDFHWVTFVGIPI